MAYAQVHGVRPREHMDKIVLFLAFAAGCFGSAYLKIMDVHPFWTAGFPILVLVAYAAICMSLRSATIEPDIAGDNCYYLGFLFTLTSLAVTLYEIHDLSTGQGSTARASQVIPAVISGFGLALASTIAGVFLRVFLIQMRPDIVARDRESRRNLAAGVREFQTAITQASRRLKDISVETAQHMVERNARIDEITDRHAQQVGDLLAQQARSFEAAVEAAAARLADEVVARISGETDKAAAQMREAADRLSQSITDLSRVQVENLPRLEKAQDFVETALRRWAEAIEGQKTLSGEAAQVLSGEVGALLAAVQAHRKVFTESTILLKEQTDAMLEANEGQRRTLSQITETLARHSAETAEALSTQQAAAAQATQTLAGQTACMEGTITQAIEAIDAGARRIEERALSSLSVQSASLEQATAQIAQAIKDGIRRIEEAATLRSLSPVKPARRGLLARMGLSRKTRGAAP